LFGVHGVFVTTPSPSTTTTTSCRNHGLPLLLARAPLLLLARAAHPRRHVAAVVVLFATQRPRHGGLLRPALAGLGDARAQGVGGGLLFGCGGSRSGAVAAAAAAVGAGAGGGRLERLEAERRAEPVVVWLVVLRC
jgi:hypothetical protein